MINTKNCSRKNPLKYILDAIDLEFFIVVPEENKAREISIEIARRLGLSNPDIVFLENKGVGSRVRVRAYINLVGNKYTWLGDCDE